MIHGLSNRKVITMKFIRIRIFVLLCFFMCSGTLLRGQERPKVGLALSGGGAKGFAHIGVLKVLHEVGIYGYDSVVWRMVVQCNYFVYVSFLEFVCNSVVIYHFCQICFGLYEVAKW